MKIRISEVARGVNAINHQRTIDMARILGINFMGSHTPCDNLVAKFLKNLIKAVKYAILCLKEEDFNGSAQSMRNILDGRENDYTFLISEKAAEEIINSIKFKKTGDFYINFLIKFSISILAYSESGGVITL